MPRCLNLLLFFFLLWEAPRPCHRPSLRARLLQWWRDAFAMETSVEATSQPVPRRRVTLQEAIQKVADGPTRDIQRVSVAYTAEVRKERPESRKQRAARKVEPYPGSLERFNTVGLSGLADAAKIASMEEHVKNKPCYIINPESIGMTVWDSVTALALIFTAMVTPFEVGFLPSAESALEALFLINRLLDGDAAG